MVHHTYDLLGNPIRVYMPNKKLIRSYKKDYQPVDWTGRKKSWWKRFKDIRSFKKGLNQKYNFFPKSEMKRLIDYDAYLQKLSNQPETDIGSLIVVLAVFFAIFLVILVF